MNAEEHSFAGELSELVHRAHNVTPFAACAEGGADDMSSGRCHAFGLIERDVLRGLLPLDDFSVYLCGPEGFMAAMRAALVSLGVADESIEQDSSGSGTRSSGAAEPRSSGSQTEKVDVPSFARRRNRGCRRRLTAMAFRPGTANNGLIRCAETSILGFAPRIPDPRPSSLNRFS